MGEKFPGVTEGVRAILNELAGSLAQVLESMTDRRPGAEWEPVAGTLSDVDPGPEAKVLWWQQKFSVLPEPALSVGAPEATWESLGTSTLRAAGLETVETADARNTWLEILNQSLSSTARSVGARLGEEVTCTEGVEEASTPDGGLWFRIVLSYDSALPPILVMLSAGLIERVDGAPSGAQQEAEPGRQTQGPPQEGSKGGRTMELLLDVELPVSLSFGRSQIPLKEVLKLTTGSIVELNRTVTEPVDVLVNQCLIARGEVVVIDGNYAVRIQQIVSAQERLRSVR